MTRSFAILVLILWTCTGAQGQTTKNEIHIRATVQSVSLVGTFSGTNTPVSGDPRFALTLLIESASPTIANFEAGAVVTLGIHSLSLLFAGESPKGKTYNFVLHREVEDGRVRYFGLTARKVPDKGRIMLMSRRNSPKASGRQNRTGDFGGMATSFALGKRRTTS